MKFISKTIICAFGVCATLALASCNGAGGQIAAEVNNEKITEESVTKIIENNRKFSELQDEEAWGQWLTMNGFTPESLRENVINNMVDEKLRESAAKEKGIEISDTEIDEAITSLREGLSDEDWKANLEQMGITEEELRNNVRSGMISTKLQEKFAEEANPTEEELLSLARAYSSFYDGAKKSSHILFAAEDQEKAQGVLDQINNGSLSFEDAVAQNSTDEASKNDGGNVGWDKMTGLHPEYQSALSGLNKDMVSGLVTTEYGIHIIKCTDVFNLPEGELTSLDSLPAELADDVKLRVQDGSGMVAYQIWFEEYKNAANIVINEMPKGLSYDVDVTKYQNQDLQSGEGAIEGNPEVSGSDLVEGSGSSETSPDASQSEAGDGQKKPNDA